MKLTRNTLGKRLKQARKNAGYTQQEVEAEIGIDRSRLSKIESGDLPVPSLHLRNLADLYGASFENLLRDEEAEEKQLSGFVLAMRRKAPDSPEAKRDLRKIEEFCENYIFLHECTGESNRS